MSKSISNLSIGLGMSVGSTVGGFKRVGGAVEECMSSFSTAAGTLAKFTGAAVVVNAAMDGIRSAFSGVGDAIRLASTLEQNQVAFETMTSSAAKAADLMGQIGAFAAETPFEFPELASSAKKLLAFGTAADQIVPTMRALGDISSGIGAPLNEIAELFGKARVQGTLYAEDINQLVGRGIPVIQQFAKQLHVTDGAVKKLASEGKISFSMLQQSVVDMTGAGGQFSGMMAKQSQTLGGLWSTLTDNVSMSMAKMVTTIVESFHVKGALSALIDVTGQMGGTLTGAVGTWAPIIMAKAGEIVPAVTKLFSQAYSAAASIAGKIASVFSSAIESVSPLVSVWTQVDNLRATGAALAGIAGTAAAGFIAWKTASVGLAASQAALSTVTAALSVVTTGYSYAVTAFQSVAAAVAGTQWAVATAMTAVRIGVIAVTTSTVVATAATWLAETAYGAIAATVATARIAGVAYTASVIAGTIASKASAAAWWIQNTAVAAGQALYAILSGGITASTIASGAWAAVTGVATGAQWLLNAALTANPIGLTVVAVGALAAGLGIVAARFVNVGAVVGYMKDSFDVAVYAVTHWQDSLKLAGSWASLFAVRTAAQLAYTFTEVVPSVLKWFGRNWRDIFTDIVTFTGTVFGNLLSNAANFGVALWEAIKGNGFSFEWTPLTAGFESAVKELPKIAARQIGPLESRLADGAAAAAKTFSDGFRESLAGKKPPQLPEPVAASAAAAVDKSAKSIAAKAADTLAEVGKPVVMKVDATAATKPLDDVKDKAKAAASAVQGLDAILRGSAESMKLAYQPVAAKAAKRPTAASATAGASTAAIAAASASGAQSSYYDDKGRLKLFGDKPQPAAVARTSDYDANGQLKLFGADKPPAALAAASASGAPSSYYDDKGNLKLFGDQMAQGAAPPQAAPVTLKDVQNANGGDSRSTDVLALIREVLTAGNQQRQQMLDVLRKQPGKPSTATF